MKRPHQVKSAASLRRHWKPDKLLCCALGAGLFLGATHASWAAASLGASFIGRNAPDDALTPTDSAGVVAQTFWNNISDDGTTFKGSSLPLLDSSGNFTAVQIVYDCSDSWSSDGPTVSGNDKLMKGIIKANPTPDTAPTGNTDRMLFTITNLPAGSYNVIVYAIENGTGANVDISLGSTTYYIAEENSFAGAFVKAASTTAGTYADANYAEFDAVAPANGAIVVTAKKHIEDPQVNDGAGVAGIQIVQVSGSAFPPNTQTCSITTDPTSTLTVEGGTATFTVGSSGPAKYQWQKNGTAIAGATASSYTYTPVLADNGAKFSALVFNNVITNKSADATLSVDANLPAVLTQGFMKVDRWQDIGGDTGTSGIDALKAAIAAGPQTLSYYEPGPDVPNSNPDISNFGARVWGWVKPDVTGDYDFFTRSDDSSQVFLNPTAAASGTNTLPNIQTDAPICEEDGCCNAFAEPDAGTLRTTQAPIHLEAGKLYGIVILYKEGGGGDFVQVAWRLTTDTTPAAALKPINATYCWTLATPAGQRANIATQPQSATIFEGKTATFSVSVNTTPVSGLFAVQWLTNGTPVPGVSGPSYTTPITTLADTGTQVKAHVLTLAGALDSTVATLTVLLDTNPPVVLGATAFPGTTKVGLTFDKALDPASAGLAANYKVNGVAVTGAYVRTNVANELSNEKNLVQLIVPTALTADFTVTVTGVKDFKGNAIGQATFNGKVLKLTITDIGSPDGQPGGPDPLFPATVTTWGPGAFDVLCNGNDYWNNADGFNFVWEPKTNSFDVKVRVVSVSPIDNWSAGAIEIREGPPTPTGGGWETNRHYFIKVDYGGPDACLDNTGQHGANAYEFNCRLAPGDGSVRETANSGVGNSQGWGGTGPGNPGGPTYPNAWIRIARQKSGTSDHLIGYTSSDGANWSQRMDVDLTDANHAGFLDLNGNAAGNLPDVLYVGLGSTCHTGIGNNNATNDGSNGEYWYSPANAPYGCFVIYREYGDFSSGGGGNSPTLAAAKNSDGTITLTYTGNLYSSTTVNGTYTLVSGASSPYKVNPKTTGNPATFYRAGP